MDTFTLTATVTGQGGMPLPGAEVRPFSGGVAVWKISVRLLSGAVEIHDAVAPPGFYPEGIMTLPGVNNLWVTYAIHAIVRVDYWLVAT